MEIERKFLLKRLPAMISSYAFAELEQGYLCVDPVVRVRREDDKYYMTYKGGGMLERVEYNLPLTKEGYEHLIKKSDGYVISKTRYFIAIEETEEWDKEHTPRILTHEDVGAGRVIELDVFHGQMEGLVLAEVEFDSKEQADSFQMPECFLEDVTFDGRYHNSYMSCNGWVKDKK